MSVISTTVIAHTTHSHIHIKELSPILWEKKPQDKNKLSSFAPDVERVKPQGRANPLWYCFAMYVEYEVQLLSF